MSATSQTIANSQSLSAFMAKGNTSARARILALRDGCQPKPNHPFCPPISKQADTDKTRSILWALAPKTKPAISAN